MEKQSFQNIHEVKTCMEEAGLYFSNDHTDLPGSRAYATLGGKTQLRFYTASRDGANGIQLLFTKDSEELNRLNAVLKKRVRQSTEKVRPHRIVLKDEELFTAISILKENPLNLKKEEFAEAKPAPAEAKPASEEDCFDEEIKREMENIPEELPGKKQPALRQEIIKRISQSRQRRKIGMANHTDSSKIMEEIKKLVAKGNAKRIVVKRNEEVMLSIPVTAGVIGGVLGLYSAPLLMVAGAVAAAGFSCHVEILNEDGTVDKVA